MCVCWLCLCSRRPEPQHVKNEAERRDDAIMMMHPSCMMMIPGIDEERKVNKAAEYDFVFLLSLNTSNAKQGLNLVVSCDACMISFEPIPSDLNTEIFQATQFFIASLHTARSKNSMQQRRRASRSKKKKPNNNKRVSVSLHVIHNLPAYQLLFNPNQIMSDEKDDYDEKVCMYVSSD